jgi:CubicO group peptidase (beta-lactamase class C family)
MLVFAALTAVAMARQDTSNHWASLARALEAAVESRAFPGAVVAVGRHDTVLYLHAFGRMTYDPRAPRVTTHTVYDLASLTKVVGLTTAMMQLVEEDLVGLDTPAVRYVPAFHDSTITVRQLLTHSSGLPAWRPFFQRVHTREEMFALVNAEPLEQAPGTKMVYSDLGAMVMTQIVERVIGERLDRYLQIHLWRPLGMRETRYLPPATWRTRIAPTELDTAYRHRLIRGEVHDENAFSMGGISGHAGLFSTAPDLAKFAQLMLRTLRGESSSRRSVTRTRTGSVMVHLPGGFMDSATAVMFTRAQQPGFSSRGLGWDTPDGQNSAGSRLSAHAFGHTGFTGTSIWIDPDQDLFVILLTNRVYPTRENTKIMEVRRRVADLAVSAANPASEGQSP